MKNDDENDTPHAQRERGKVIGCGVHIIYSYMFVDEKNI